MATNLRTLYEAYDTGISECTHPWEFQADVANSTYRYHPGLGYFVAPEPEQGDFVLLLAPAIGDDKPVLDRPALIALWQLNYDIVLYAWDKMSKQRAKIFFDSSVEYNGEISKRTIAKINAQRATQAIQAEAAAVEKRKQETADGLAKRRQDVASTLLPQSAAVGVGPVVIADEDGGEIAIYPKASGEITTTTFQESVARARALQDAVEAAQPYTFTFPDGITLRLSFELNDGQQRSLSEMGEWMNDPTRTTYNLKGYAGTGKTTIMKLFVEYCHRLGARRLAEKVGQGKTSFFETGGGDVLLAAPTHRARQVLYQLAGDQIPRENCHTIHSLLALRPNFDVEQLDVRNLSFAQAEGKQSKLTARATLIVDECSMLANGLVRVLEDQGG